MSKYRVTFETTVQVDGWSDWRDREYQKRRETLTVEAKNLTEAKKKAVKEAKGYHAPAYWGLGHTHTWYQENIKKITKVIKKKIIKRK